MVARLFVALTLAITAATAPIAPALADNNPAAQQSSNAGLLDFCYALIASGQYPTLNLGECMSYNLTSDSGFKTHFCDMLRETGEFADYDFSSYSDCVRNIQF